MNSNNYITTKEVAHRLNKSISTIYRYVNEKKLRPVYEDKWQIDSSLLFREEDVERLLEDQQIKPGYTTGEVAAKLSKHPSTIAMYIKTGKLKTEKRKYKGRILNFISEEELERLQKEIGAKEKGYLNIFNKQFNIHLYQSFRNSNGNTARVMSLEDGQGVAELEDERRINIEKLYQLGYLPIYNVETKRYIPKKGFVHFRFIEPVIPRYLDIIESLIINMGYNNVKIQKSEGGLVVLVKPGLIKKVHNEILNSNSLNVHLTTGSLVQRHDGILLQSEYMPILTHVRKDIKNKLKYYSKVEKVPLDDYIESILEKYFDE